MTLHLYCTNKCTKLNTYKALKMSHQHVSVHYVPLSEIVISEVLKPVPWTVTHDTQTRVRVTHDTHSCELL
jgi:hypothetical protein